MSAASGRLLGRPTMQKVTLVGAVSLALATADQLSDADVLRASTAKPGLAYVAPDVHSMGRVLNNHLRRISGSFTDCDGFDAATLLERRRHLFEHVDPALVAIYPARDRRTPRHTNESVSIASAAPPFDPELRVMQRDGLCHEVVLMLVHHLSTAKRTRLLAADGASYPLLPTRHHAWPSAASTDTEARRVASECTRGCARTAVRLRTNRCCACARTAVRLRTNRCCACVV
jgi:hypothetical protein